MHSSVLNSKYSKCDILQLIIENDDVAKILSYYDRRAAWQNIRVFDLSGNNFNKCYLLYLDSTKNIIINGYVEPKLKSNINTGQYRDIIIKEYKEVNNTIQVKVETAFFIGQWEKEGYPYLEFEFNINNEGILKLKNLQKKMIKDSYSPRY